MTSLQSENMLMNNNSRITKGLGNEVMENTNAHGVKNVIRSNVNSNNVVDNLDDGAEETKLCAALGISSITTGVASKDDIIVNNDGYIYSPNPEADEVDLSVLRGVKNVSVPTLNNLRDINKEEKDADLTALSELVPGLIDKKKEADAAASLTKIEVDEQNIEREKQPENNLHPAEVQQERYGLKEELILNEEEKCVEKILNDDVSSVESTTTFKGDGLSHKNNLDAYDLNILMKTDPMRQPSNGDELLSGDIEVDLMDIDSASESSSHNNPSCTDVPQQPHQDETLAKPPSSHTTKMNPSSASLGNSTVATHEVRMPMYLPTFKPATGCTNASDFIVRCFVARLRAGITVVKHGRSRWCKSRLRILHVHPDGRSLSWKPAMGEPTSSKRPPKLDLSTCSEVRHAWSIDPPNPMFTGTPILRQKCEAANAHKSFALIFPKRTVDITAVTADQCKVLMEGFSALCFRLQVASLAGKKQLSGVRGEESQPDDDERSTVSNSLTNNSTVSPTTGTLRRSAYR